MPNCPDDEPCPVCGSTIRRDVAGTPYRSCLACGHHDAGDRVASGSVVNHAVTASPPTISPLEREQVRALRRAGWRDQPLVDLGCGHGGFLHAVATRHGLPDGSYGVEVTPESIDAARRWYGLDVRPEVSDLEGPVALTSWHSAEHIPVSAVRSMLSKVFVPGSVVVISVPNAASWQWHLFKTKWTYYDVGAHRSQFTPRSLDLLVEQAGGSPAARPRLVLYELFGAVQSLVNLVCPHNRLYETLKRGRGNGGRTALLVDLSVAAIAAIPAAFLTLGGLIVRNRAGCVNVAYRPTAR